MTDRSEKLRDQVDRGRRYAIAQKVLEETKQALEQQLFESFRNSDVHDSKGHQAQRFYLKVLDDTFKRFEYFIRTGEDARKELIKMKPKSILRKVANG